MEMNHKIFDTENNEITPDEFAKYMSSGRYDFSTDENGYWYLLELSLTEEQSKIIKRSRRTPLLVAWDTLIANANFGTITLIETRKQELIKWHQDILDLKEDAINNPPDEIKYYL